MTMVPLVLLVTTFAINNEYRENIKTQKIRWISKPQSRQKLVMEACVRTNERR